MQWSQTIRIDLLFAQKLNEQFNMIGKQRPALPRVLAEYFERTGKKTATTGNNFRTTARKDIKSGKIF